MSIILVGDISINIDTYDAKKHTFCTKTDWIEDHLMDHMEKLVYDIKIEMVDPYLCKTKLVYKGKSIQEMYVTRDEDFSYDILVGRLLARWYANNVDQIVVKER